MPPARRTESLGAGLDGPGVNAEAIAKESLAMTTDPGRRDERRLFGFSGALPVVSVFMIKSVRGRGDAKMTRAFPVCEYSE
jgi:hypothetical protein